MKRASFIVTLSALISLSAFSPASGSTLWLASPTSGDWNTGANWTGGTVPNANGTTAAFGTSGTTSVALSANVLLDGITFNSGASAYTITAIPGTTLTLNGAGITNNSGSTQNFVGAQGPAANGGVIFNNSATAGVNTVFANAGASSIVNGAGFTQFNDTTNAGSASFTNNGGTRADSVGGSTLFYGTSSAASGTFTNNGATASGAYGGSTAFFDNATSGSGTFINNGGIASGSSFFIGFAAGPLGGETVFSGNSTAGTASTFNNYGSTSTGSGGRTIFNDNTSAGAATYYNYGATILGGGGGSTQFGYSANSSGPTAGSGTFYNYGSTVSGANGGFTNFRYNSFASSATLIATAGTNGGLGGSIFFYDHSMGGTATVQVDGNGQLDISGETALSVGATPTVTIGSLAGTGNVFLGASNLTVGSNNATTTFSGVIQDGGFTVNPTTGNPLTGGSLTKIGTGTLTLSGANTYTGATTVNGGTLALDTSTNATVLNPTSALVLGGGTFQLKGTSGTQSQAMNGLTVNSGASVVDVSNTGTTTTLDVGGSITRNTGATVDFTASNGTLGTTALVATTQANDATGIIGAWATVNGGAALATNNGSNVIVPFTGYTNISNAGSTIADNASSNVRINSAGTTGSVILGATPTTTVNTLTQNYSSAAVVDTGGNTLRVGAAGGVFITPTGGNLTLGTSAGSGTLTAGGADNTAGEVILGNFSTTNTLTVNAAIADNGTGSVAVTKAGGGLAVLATTNTYTGGTYVNAGTLQMGGANILASTGALTVQGGTLDLNGHNQTTGPFTISSGAVIGTGQITASAFNLLGGSFSASNIGGSNPVTISSGGSLIFSNGTTSFSNPVTVAQGSTGSISNTGGGTLTLSGGIDKKGSILTLTGGGTINITGPITGDTGQANSDLVVDGTVANLNNSNSYNGPTYLRNGATINANVTGALPTGTRSDVTLDATGSGGSTLALGADQVAASLSGASSSKVTLGSYNLTVGANTGTTTTFAGVISGTGNFAKDGTNTQILTGTNTYSGTTTVSGGTLSVDNNGGGTAGTLGSGAVTVNGGQSDFASGGTLQFLTAASAGSRTFTNNGGAGQYASGGDIEFNKGSTASSGTFTTYGGTASQAFGATVKFNDQSTAGTASFTTNGGTFSGAGPSAYGGTTSFTGSATAANASFVTNGGSVQYANGGKTTFDGSSATVFATAGSATFTNNAGTAYNAQGGTTSFTGYASAGSATFTNYGSAYYAASGGSTTFTGQATAANGNFTTYGATGFGGSAGMTSFSGNSTAGSATFTNDGATFTGGTGGLLTFNDNSTAGTSTITNNQGSTNFTDSSSAGSSTITSNGGSTNFASGGTTTFSVNADAGSATLIATAGTSGGFGGQISFNADSTGGTAAVKLTGTGSGFTSSILDISGHNNATTPTVGTGYVAIGSLEGSGVVLLGKNNLTVGGNNNSTTFSGVLKDGSLFGGLTGGSFTKVGTGTLTLSGANSFTGGTLVSAGTLQMGENNVLAASGALTVAGGTLDLQSYNQNVGAFTITSGSVIGSGLLSASSYAIQGGTFAASNIGGGGAVTISAGGSLNFSTNGNSSFTNDVEVAAGSGTISNSGSGTLTLTGQLNKAGTVLTLTGGGTINVSGNIVGSIPNSDLVVDGTVVNLNSTSSYNGPTYIRNGATLNANVVGSLPTSTRSAVTLDDSGRGSSTLALGADQVTASLTGATTSQVNLGSHNFTVGAASGTTTFAGVISGSGGSLTKDGASTQVLSGTSTYTGTTEVNAGTLMVNGSIAASSSVAVDSGALLSGHGSVSVITGAGTVSPGDTAPGTLTATLVDPTIGIGFDFRVHSGVGFTTNDLLHLTGGNPFNSSLLTSSNSVTVDLTGDAPGSYLGGFYTDIGNTLTSVQNANFNYVGLPGGESVVVSMIPNTTYNANGYITEFTITSTAPEATRALLLLTGFAALGLRRRRSLVRR